MVNRFFHCNIRHVGDAPAYGSLIYWIATAGLIVFGRKHLSRDFDVFGGLIFATVGIAWLFMVFPFEFAYFTDVLPDFLRFLV